MSSDYIDRLMRECMSMEAALRQLTDRLLAIRTEAQEELERIEKHGGCAGFALLVLAMTGGRDE